MGGEVTENEPISVDDKNSGKVREDEYSNDFKESSDSEDEDESEQHPLSNN